MRKLNVLLALTDQLRVQYKNMIADYSKFFSKSQGAFLGVKKTYVPKEGTIDDPKLRGVIPVATTVEEKLDYFIENTKDFIDALFSQEKTNASGLATASLVVDGNNWGTFTSLELLRLKTLIESSDLGKLEEMLMNIPVRSDSEVWFESDIETGRQIWSTELLKGVNKTTIKEPFIVKDPNLETKDIPVGYNPPVVSRDVVHELGDYTVQHFSGQWSQRQRALALKRRAALLSAITVALKEANETEAIESDLTGKRIFNYLFFGD